MLKTLIHIFTCFFFFLISEQVGEWLATSQGRIHINRKFRKVGKNYRSLFFFKKTAFFVLLQLLQLFVTASLTGGKSLSDLFSIVWDDVRSPKNIASHLLDSGEMIKNLFWLVNWARLERKLESKQFCNAKVLLLQNVSAKELDIENYDRTFFQWVDPSVVSCHYKSHDPLLVVIITYSDCWGWEGIWI